MKKKYKLRKWVKVAIVLLSIIVVFGIINTIRKEKDTKLVQNIKQEEKLVVGQINSVLKINNKIEEIEVEEPQEEIYEESINTYTTRMTSYYPEEGETMTASGLGIDNFGVNENGWFTYNGRIVVATASTRLGYTDMRTFNLYDELTLNIDGIDYQAIVLDVCGSCMWDNRIDLFASSVVYAKDTMIEVKIK